MQKFVRFIIVAFCLGASAQVQAHGGHDERIKLRLSDKRLVFETHIPARLLSRFDMDGNGTLSASEFRARISDIRQWVSDNVIVRNAIDGPLEPAFFDMPVSQGDISHADGHIEFVRIIRLYERPEAPGLSIHISLFEKESKPVLLFRGGQVFRKTFPPGGIRMAF